MSIRGFCKSAAAAGLLTLPFLGLGTAMAQGDNDQYQWNIGSNVQVGVHAAINLDAYNVSNTSSVLHLDGDHKTDTQIRNAFLVLAGKVYDFDVFSLFDMAGDTGNKLVWAWISHKVGPGSLAFGQHWNYSSIEEPMPTTQQIFLERNGMDASGLDGLRSHSTGLFYQLATPYGDGNNNIFAAASVYNLKSRVGPPWITRNNGWGTNVALRWAPVVTDNHWVQLGAAAGYAESNSDGFLWSGVAYPAGIDDWDGAPSLALRGANSDVTTGSVNAMAAFGSLFFEGEFGLAHYSSDAPLANVAPPFGGGTPSKSETVQNYSVTLGYWLTGETMGYNANDGTYALAQPKHQYGAVLAAINFNSQKNKDAGANNRSTCAYPSAFDSDGDPTAFASYDKCQFDTIRAVVSYFPNPMVRIMGQVAHTNVKLGNVAASDEDPTSVALRVQFHF